jgi:putative oxidoreductase
VPVSLSALFDDAEYVAKVEEFGYDRQKSAMKRLVPNIAGVLLGFLFVMAAVVVLFNLVKPPPPPEGSPAAMFMGAFVPTGYMTFVKILELIGGVLVAIPRTRNIGLLILGPIIMNILAFTIFVAKGEGLLGIPLVVAFLALYLLWVERRAFAALVCRRKEQARIEAPAAAV